MSRIPSGLLYLAIYNPTLSPKQPVDDDDEDAEEQAHILFYTSKETAVSRDRMLRQIGLAKALVNFSSLFNPNDLCESIHSQTRRTILVCPEPNFWINAAIELPKKPQKPTTTSTGKGKSKSKAPAPPSTEVVYDHEDGTVHDTALKAKLLRAYESFKLRHGSLTTILHELGQEALELQLERFFTPWAWSWDLASSPQLSEQLGIPLQPYHSTLIPLIDGYSATIPETIIPFIVSRTHIIPSTRYIGKTYTTALAEYLMTMIPPPRTLTEEETLASPVATIQPTPTAEPSASNSPGMFNLPSVNMPNVKWNWQNYLTFGKNGASSSNPSPKEKVEEQETQASEEVPPPAPDDVKSDAVEQPRPSMEVEIDSSSLEEALSSEGASSPSPDVAATQRMEVNSVEDQGTSHNEDVESHQPDADGDSLALTVEPVSSSPQSSRTILPRPHPPSSPTPSSPPLPTWSRCKVHMPSSENRYLTETRVVHYCIRNELMLALLEDPGPASPEELEELLAAAAEDANDLLKDIELTIQNAALSKLSESIPTMSKILQTPDQYAISTDQFMLQSPGFSSDSSHLHNATALMERDPNILEVYSRGQNPQYWHVAKRGLGSSQDAVGHQQDSSMEEGAASLHSGIAYLEVFKKESSLPDVDNALAGIVRKSGIGESGLL